ncbi:hypothetical protein [Cetobacterium sp.]|uniref:hypothetical protein n=1 Tax=Cetobacterium sp. TaxID=2071632 RepID=UPI003F351014
MKFKGAIGLSFFLLASSLLAKEVVVVPVEEAVPEVIVEEIVTAETVPMMPKEEMAFKPSGSFGLQLKYYGQTEGSEAGEGKWNSNNESMRAQYLLTLQATEKTKMQFRLRDYQALNSEKEGDLGSDKRLRIYHTHNNLFTSFFEYRGATRFIMKSYNLIDSLNTQAA